MSETQLPRQINILREADRGTQFHGKFAINDMPHLMSLLVSKDGEGEIDLYFGKDDDGRRFVKGQLDCSVTMRCQRCLQPVTIKLDDEFSLSPVLSDGQAKGLPSEYEPLMTERDGQELLPIIEEELILQLPIVAMHETETCHAQPEAVKEEEQTDDNNPFVRELSKIKDIQ